MDYQGKARGMLVGLAVGDALGAPVEFLPSPSDVYIETLGDEIEHFHENTRLPNGVWTDDTSMALCIADSLLERGGYDSFDIMDRFCDWCDHGYRMHPQAPIDIGMQTLNSLDNFKKNPIIKRDRERTESAGNGAIMRLAPIVIANTFLNKKYPTLKDAYKKGRLVADPGDDDGEYIDKKDILPTLKMAELSAIETHDSVAACAVTEMFASVLYMALHGLEKHNIANYAARFVDGREYSDFCFDNMDDLINKPFKKQPLLFCDLGGYIVDTFAISLWGLLNYGNFKDGMLAVIRLGGDTDTNAACYGQLAGAYYGYSKIPKEWREGVYLADELVEIADKLLEMDKCPIIRTRFE